jgi:hypothetical protein
VDPRDPSRWPWSRRLAALSLASLLGCETSSEALTGHECAAAGGTCGPYTATYYCENNMYPCPSRRDPEIPVCARVAPVQDCPYSFGGQLECCLVLSGPGDQVPDGPLPKLIGTPDAGGDANPDSTSTNAHEAGPG